MADYKKLLSFLKIDNIIDHISELIEAKVEVYKVELKYEVAKIGAKLLSFIILSFFISLIVIFLSFSAATLINSLMDSRYWGFVIVTGFYTLLVVLYLSFKVNLGIQHFFEKMLIGDTEFDSEEIDNGREE